MKEVSEVTKLKGDLSQEIKYTDQMLASNKELEESIRNMERELARLQKEDPKRKLTINQSQVFARDMIEENSELEPLYTLFRSSHQFKETRLALSAIDIDIDIMRVNHCKDPISPNTNSISYEGYHRLQEQLKINMKLEKDASLEQERLRILADSEADITDLNLENLSQSELIRVVKQLERLRTDLQSNLRETEQQLDVQAKAFFKLNETRKLYQTELELRERNKGIKRLEYLQGHIDDNVHLRPRS